MKIIHSVEEMHNLSVSLTKSGRRIGLVPTMGALHEGHLSLLDRARQKADVAVVSIFVNPRQFGPGEDYQRYPRPLDQDREAAREAGCDFLFIPDAAQMYPDDYMTSVQVSGITERLEGAARPGHFNGVTTVVYRLFSIVGPQIAVFGRKDAQQAIVIKRMVSDLLLPIQIDIAPIVRESDGLAKSSRNGYLTDAERQEASCIYRGVRAAETLFARGERSPEKLIAAVSDSVATSQTIELEYAQLADIAFLRPVQRLADVPVLLAVACCASKSKTRLIDNTVLGGDI